MKDLLRKFSFLKNSFTGLNSWSGETKYILFDSSEAAMDIAFMLGGEWDRCNGVVMHKSDQVAVDTAANLVGAKWCYTGASLAVLTRLAVDQLQRRYAAGERNFYNANLRCALLSELNLSGVKLAWSKLSLANLSKANLSGADLTAADLSEVNLSGADLSKACLNEANLSQADLRRANLSLADLRRANISQTNLSGANLRGAKLNKADLIRAIISDETICN
jgi:uncharacterized protein YjbI with pentapeptide repeats